MGASSCAVAVAAILVLTASAWGQYVPNDPAGWAAWARDNPLAFFGKLAQMSAEEQRQVLKATGEDIKQRSGLPCNPFGGEESCMTLPVDSKFAAVCPEHDLRVDCAYYTDGLQEINNNPEEDIRTIMGNSGRADLMDACPQCFSNIRRLWCAQTVPKCGSYKVVEAVLLPALATIIASEENGVTPVEALAQAVPQLLQASNLALPCRAMCEAVVGTCSCSRDRKFGELLDKAAANHYDLPGMGVPEGFTRQLFGQLYDAPLCSLFADGNATGFTGHCDALPATCTDTQRWCHGDHDSNPGPDAVEELMALQLAKGLFGWVPSLNKDEQQIIDETNSQSVESLEDKYLRSSDTPPPAPQQRSMLHAVAIVTLVLAVGAAAGGVAVWGYFRWRDSRVTGFNRAGYMSMAEVEPPTFSAPLRSVDGV